MLHPTISSRPPQGRRRRFSRFRQTDGVRAAAEIGPAREYLDQSGNLTPEAYIRARDLSERQGPLPLGAWDLKNASLLDKFSGPEVNTEILNKINKRSIESIRRNPLISGVCVGIDRSNCTIQPQVYQPLLVCMEEQNFNWINGMERKFTLTVINDSPEAHPQSILRLSLHNSDGKVRPVDELPETPALDFREVKLKKEAAPACPAAREEKPDAVVIGEVWEDGSTKIAYGVRRKHILGGHCDGLMNYPLRSAILAFFTGGGGEHFVESMETIRENYPAFAFYSAMNSLDTHDTPRFLTLMGAGGEYRHQSKEWRANFRLSPKQRRRGKDLLRAASLLLFCFPGSPTIYYGDEAGMEGFEDPFNRQTYPWGHEDRELLDWYRALGQVRKKYQALRRGSIRYVYGKGPLLAFVRREGKQRLLCAFNASENPQAMFLEGEGKPEAILGRASIEMEESGFSLTVPPQSGVLMELK